MFQPDCTRQEDWQRGKDKSINFKSNLGGGAVDKTMLLYWMEHCVECAVPHCYQSCKHYIKRIDRQCARFAYGIQPNKEFSGQFNFGADICFLKWGKLQANICNVAVSATQQRILQSIDFFADRLVNFTSNILQSTGFKRRLNGRWAYFKEKFLNNLAKRRRNEDFFDDFVIEAFVCGKKHVRFILEYWGDELKLRHSFIMYPGTNFFTIPFAKFKLDCHKPNNPKENIRIYPEGSTEVRVIFTWLDFVKYKSNHPNESIGKGSVKGISKRTNAKPAEKVKCVAWDLDNTLWNGILLEDGSNGIKINPDALKLIKQLDERGIIQTIASKNNFEDAWGVIKRMELQDYFLYPAISWGQKSNSVKEIAEKLNINVDTFALIDDSEFERAEVKSVLPQVRVYSDKDIHNLLRDKAFDVPVTSTSKARRFLYLNDMERVKAKEHFSGKYVGFLRSCNMELEIFIPQEHEHIKRCLELIQRSNQLNLSAKRYTEEQFNHLLSDNGMLCLALSCKDRFGDYGIIGFISIDKTKKIPILSDFVISCRVAKKMVEHTFFKWLVHGIGYGGRKVVQANLIKTGKNTPLVNVFEEIGSRLIKKEGNNLLVELSIDNTTKIEDVIKLKVHSKIDL
jgi:FkbH-like protein